MDRSWLGPVARVEEEGAALRGRTKAESEAREAVMGRKRFTGLGMRGRGSSEEEEEGEAPESDPVGRAGGSASGSGAGGMMRAYPGALETDCSWERSLSYVVTFPAVRREMISTVMVRRG